LSGLETCEAVYRPTNFWTPGVQRLLGDMSDRGIDTFKSWPQAFFWFYPIYGKALRPALRRRLVRIAAEGGPSGTEKWIKPLLRGVSDARRDTGWSSARTHRC
jgi:hypothetical protein